MTVALRDATQQVTPVPRKTLWESADPVQLEPAIPVTPEVSSAATTTRDVHCATQTRYARPHLHIPAVALVDLVRVNVSIRRRRLETFLSCRTVASRRRGVIDHTTPVHLGSGDIFNRPLLDGEAWQVPLVNSERALCYAC